MCEYQFVCQYVWVYVCVSISICGYNCVGVYVRGV